MMSNRAGCSTDCSDSTTESGLSPNSTSTSAKNGTKQHNIPNLIILVFSLNGAVPTSNYKSMCSSPCQTILCPKCFSSKVKKSYFKLVLLTICLTLMALGFCDIQFRMFIPTNTTFGVRSSVMKRVAVQNMGTTSPQTFPSPSQDSDQHVNLKLFIEDKPNGLRRLPDCIIFGVSKCGTRAVLEYLKLHPDVVAPSTEINFFQNLTLYERGISWYIQQMPSSKPQQITVEKSPDYFQHHTCADRIYATSSSIKLLLLLRDPVERLVSQYMQLREKHTAFPEFEEWVLDSETDSINARLPSVNVSIYSDHLSYWFKIFPRNQFHIIESRSLRDDPLYEMKRVETFLNLNPFYTSEDFYFNNSRGFFCTRIRSTGKTKCLGKSKGRQHIPVVQDVLDKLYNFYKPYNEKLSQILGYKFQWA